MSKKNKKPKKVSAKKEKYAKFHKEKPSSIDLTMPDLSPEQTKQKQEDELKISRFLRFNKNPPSKPIRERNTRGK